MMNRVVYLAFCLSALFVAGVIGSIIQRPLNAAMSVGEETFLKCTSDNTSAITWMYTSGCKSGVGTTLTDSNCNITSNHSSHYRTEKPGGFVCNLVVFDALLTHGGCYICADGIGTGRQYSAYLIVLDSNANFKTNTTDLVSDEYVTISNNISYGGPSLQPPSNPAMPPSFYWTLQSDLSHNITSYSGTTTINSASSYIVVEAQKPEVPPFVCNLFFNAPGIIPSGCANNAPTYRTSWKTPTYKVSYPPENIYISEITMSCPYNKSVFITCNASGYPIPTYTWLDLTNGGEPFHGSTLQVDRGGIYQCVASSIIRDVTHSESKSVNVSYCFTYVIDAIQPPTDDTWFIAVLVIVIYFGLNLLFFTVFVICYGCSKNGRNTLNDRFPWLREMLPCMNDDGCKCSVWIVYFVILSIFAAFVFFPTIVIMVSCCRTQKKTSHDASSGSINLREGVYVYENEMKPNTLPEASPYESLQRPTTQSTTPFYEELSHGHHEILK